MLISRNGKLTSHHYYTNRNVYRVHAGFNLHMEPITIFAVALAGALAILAGIFEDLESDTGSQSNPNSQVQLAPQIGHLHRYFNKAISGEPPAYGFWSATGATVAVLLQTRFLSGFGEMHSVILASIFGALVAASILSFYAIFAHISRTASMRPFKQPLQLDVILSPLPLFFAYGFLAVLCITLISFITNMVLLNPFPVPLIALLFGITLGTIGSSTGDIHYGSERLYQTFIFGSGIPISKQGDIDVKAEYGFRNSIDTPYFTSRFGGPVTGLCFGAIVFLDNWSRLFNFAGKWTPILLGIIIIILLFIINLSIEIYTRNRFNEFTKE